MWVVLRKRSSVGGGVRTMSLDGFRLVVTKFWTQLTEDSFNELLGGMSAFFNDVDRLVPIDRQGVLDGFCDTVFELISFTSSDNYNVRVLDELIRVLQTEPRGYGGEVIRGLATRSVDRVVNNFDDMFVSEVKLSEFTVQFECFHKLYTAATSMEKKDVCRDLDSTLDKVKAIYDTRDSDVKRRFADVVFKTAKTVYVWDHGSPTSLTIAPFWATFATGTAFLRALKSDKSRAYIQPHLQFMFHPSLRPYFSLDHDKSHKQRYGVLQKIIAQLKSVFRGGDACRKQMIGAVLPAVSQTDVSDDPGDIINQFREIVFRNQSFRRRVEKEYKAAFRGYPMVKLSKQAVESDHLLLAEQLMATTADTSKFLMPIVQTERGVCSQFNALSNVLKGTTLHQRYSSYPPGSYQQLLNATLTDMESTVVGRFESLVKNGELTQKDLQGILRTVESSYSLDSLMSTLQASLLKPEIMDCLLNPNSSIDISLVTRLYSRVLKFDYRTAPSHELDKDPRLVATNRLYAALVSRVSNVVSHSEKDNKAWIAMFDRCISDIRWIHSYHSKGLMESWASYHMRYQTISRAYMMYTLGAGYAVPYICSIDRAKPHLKPGEATGLQQLKGQPHNQFSNEVELQLIETEKQLAQLSYSQDSVVLRPTSPGGESVFSRRESLKVGGTDPHIELRDIYTNFVAVSNDVSALQSEIEALALVPVDINSENHEEHSEENGSLTLKKSRSNRKGSVEDKAFSGEESVLTDSDVVESASDVTDDDSNDLTKSITDLIAVKEKELIGKKKQLRECRSRFLKAYESKAKDPLVHSDALAEALRLSSTPESLNDSMRDIYELSEHLVFHSKARSVLDIDRAQESTFCEYLKEIRAHLFKRLQSELAASMVALSNRFSRSRTQGESVWNGIANCVSGLAAAVVTGVASTSSTKETARFNAQIKAESASVTSFMDIQAASKKVAETLLDQSGVQVLIGSYWRSAKIPPSPDKLARHVLSNMRAQYGRSEGLKVLMEHVEDVSKQANSTQTMNDIQNIGVSPTLLMKCFKRSDFEARSRLALFKGPRSYGCIQSDKALHSRLRKVALET